jgi:poly-gamma-glutamate synthase PgsB/CapB
LFPDNVALGLACAEAFDIDHETALRGMLKARPDPGVLKITKLDEEIWGGAVFANGFAANEPASTLLIWKRLKENHSFSGEIVVLFNGRPDRVDRTKQFVNDFFPHLEGAFLIGMGQEIRDIQRAWENGKFPGISEYLHWENYSVDELLENIKPFIRNRLLFGVGNIHGDGEGFVERLLEPGESVPEQAEAVYKKDPWERSEEKATAKLASI